MYRFVARAPSCLPSSVSEGVYDSLAMEFVNDGLKVVIVPSSRSAPRLIQSNHPFKGDPRDLRGKLWIRFY
jgi:hypothetical protein